MILIFSQNNLFYPISFNLSPFQRLLKIKKEDAEFRRIVEEIGYKVKDDAKDFKDEIQPRFVFRLDIKGKTEDEILANCHQKTRYNIRLATKFSSKTFFKSI